MSASKNILQGTGSARNLDLLTSRAFERVARSASEHTRPENQGNDFEKVYKEPKLDEHDELHYLFKWTFWGLAKN